MLQSDRVILFGTAQDFLYNEEVARSYVTADGSHKAMKIRQTTRNLIILSMAFSLWAVASAMAAKRMNSEVTCEPTDKPLMYRCAIRLSDKKTGQPIEGAKFMMLTSMPDMPMAHHMPPVEGKAGAEPGLYHGIFHFEMAGEWAIDIRTSAPARDQMRHTIMVHQQGAGSQAGKDINANKGTQIFRFCAFCHSLNPGETKVGPSLAGLFGRRAGSVEGFRYSKALKQAAEVWDERTLDAWLANPSKFIPGNRMRFRGLKSPEARANVIDYLKQATRQVD